jgi:hypothetical protein
VAGKYTRSGFETRTVRSPTWTSVAGAVAMRPDRTGSRHHGGGGPEVTGRPGGP